MQSPLQYENISVLDGLVDELKVLLKKETALQNSINVSVDEINDHNTIKTIKSILLKKENNLQLDLLPNEQKNVDSLLIPKNVLQLIKNNYPMVFQEIGVFDKIETLNTVEDQNMILKLILKKVTNDNNILIRHLQTDQINGSMVVVNKFKLLLNAQLETMTAGLASVYKDKLFPLEDVKIMQEDISGIKSPAYLESVYIILKQIEEEIRKVDI
ncbi:hypothetical protein QEN19_000430 [Hanseniaspora menglaensis]